jgi:hypothetical protein
MRRTGSASAAFEGRLNSPTAKPLSLASQDQESRYKPAVSVFAVAEAAAANLA